MSDQSTPGPEGTSEQLTNDGGTRTGGGRKRGLVIGGAVAAVAVAGGAAWAATSFLGQGAQPAEALPAATLGYASVDLDPSGSQKVEALQVLRKFPAIKEELDLGSGDDLREKLFTELTSSCEGGVDFADDVAPWLGNRAAAAAVEVDGKPTPVVVLQHTDAGAAEDGLATINEACGGEDAAYDVGEEWIVVGQSKDVLSSVSGLVDQGTLADDEDYQRWTDEAGDPGIMSLYAAPEAGPFLARNMDELGGMGGMDGMEGMSGAPTQEVPEEAMTALEEFGGGAATLRFDDGGLELEAALDGGKQADLVAGATGGGEVVGGLPDDTAVALGFGVPDDFVSTMLDQVATQSGGQMTRDQLEQQIQANLGVTADDLQTLLGDAVAVAVGPDFDVQEMVNSSSPDSLPVGVKVKGDTGGIEGVLGKIQPQLGPMGTLLQPESEGDYVAISPNADYRSQLVGEGSLGDSAVFDEVVEDGDEAAGVAFVNFDAGDGGWLEGLAAGDPKAEENLEPLSAFGLSSRVDDDVARVSLRLTTN